MIERDWVVQVPFLTANKHQIEKALSCKVTKVGFRQFWGWDLFKEGGGEGCYKDKRSEVTVHLLSSL